MRTKISLFILTIALALSCTSSVYAWTNTTTSATSSNTLAPINVSSNTQSKFGSLTINSLKSYVNGLLVYGKTLLPGGVTIGATSIPSNTTIYGGSGSVFEIGTTSAPVSTFRIVTGTVGANKVLTSDANGVGTWSNLVVASSTEMIFNKSKCAQSQFVIGFDSNGNVICTDLELEPCPVPSPLAKVSLYVDENVYLSLSGTSITPSYWTRNGGVITSYRVISTGMPRDGASVKVTALSSDNYQATILQTCQNWNMVCISQQPASWNNYTTIIQVFDGANSAHNWSFDIAYE